MPQARALPQPSSPPDGTPYEYVRLEDVARRFFRGGFQRGGGQLVWVCKSKGRRKRRDPDLTGASPAQPQQPTPSHPRQQHHHIQGQAKEARDGNGTHESSSKGAPSKAEIHFNQSPICHLELFLRARVVESLDRGQPDLLPAAPDDGEPNPSDDRVLVRYPKGSTYRVRRDHLLPVLEGHRRIVIVVDETPLYRKCCAVHTLPSETFLEIGCDLGHNLQRVHETGGERSSSGNRLLVGIDKSRFSVETAKASYPHLRFVQWDPLEHPASALSERLGGDKFHPDVVAVDINGNRELPAVVACLASIWDVHQWRPRLVVVKSRTLHAHLRDDGALEA
jgi:hypothetical protein